MAPIDFLRTSGNLTHLLHRYIDEGGQLELVVGRNGFSQLNMIAPKYKDNNDV